MITVQLLDPRATPDHVGLIPGFLDERDPQPASKQFDEQYIGGWRPMNGFTRDGTTLRYPGDPPMTPLAYIAFRDEHIFIYRYSFVMILQSTGSFAVARMD